jgi:hypothetical protein
VWTNDYDMRKTLLNLPCICVCVHCLLSEFYTTEASVIITEVLNSYFHLYGCGYYHYRIDEAPLVADIHDAEDGSVANYLEYYD